MKRLSLIFLTLTILLSCEKDKSEPNTDISILPNKDSYSINDQIIIEIINKSDSVARYFVCSSYEGIPPLIYKKENDSWNAYWGPICNGYMSFCCAELSSGSSFKDTINVEFEKGTYRFEYQFIIRPSHEYQTFYSNPIIIN